MLKSSVIAIILLFMCIGGPNHAQSSATAYQLVGHFGENVYTFDWSPDGTSIVTSTLELGWDLGNGRRNDQPPVVQLWSVALVDGEWSATLTDTLDGFERGIRVVAWSPDGRQIAIIENHPATLRIWDVERREFSTEIPFISYTMHWGPDSQSLIFVAQQIEVVNAHTGHVMARYFLPAAEQPTTTNPWWIPDAQLNPSGTLLAAITPQRNDQYKLVIWNLLTDEEPLLIDDVGYDLAWSPDGRYLATYTGVFDALTGEKVIDAAPFPFGFLYPSWSFDGTYLATTDFIFDVGAGEPVELAGDPPRLACRQTAWSPVDYVATCLKFDYTIDVWGMVGS